MYTHAGDLNCDYILHLCLPDKQATDVEIEREAIYSMTMNCLQITNKELKLNSIAFPLL